MNPTAHPALLGDGHGRYRVSIIGNSGSGKSTLGCALAALLKIPYIPLDVVFWEPGWKQTPADDFCVKLRAAMGANDKGWVIDGNYQRLSGDMVHREATDIIWLDPPLLLYFPRLCWRTLLRLLSLRPPCSPGCPETVRECFFSRESILIWCLSNHWVVRKKNSKLLRELEIGLPGGKMRRFGGWGGELNRWKRDVVTLAHSQDLDGSIEECTKIRC